MNKDKTKGTYYKENKSKACILFDESNGIVELMNLQGTQKCNSRNKSTSKSSGKQKIKLRRNSMNKSKSKFRRNN